MKRIGPQNYVSMDDNTLATHARRDIHAAEEVLVRVRPRVKSVVRAMVGNDRDYEDLISQVSLQVLESIGNYKGTGALQMWAGRIAFHVVVKHKKRRNMIEKIMLSDLYERGIESSNPETQATQNHVRDKMIGLLHQIPKVRQDALVLRLICGHSIEEIAKLTRAPVNTVRGRLRMGLRELRQGMSAERDCILAKQER